MECVQPQAFVMGNAKAPGTIKRRAEVRERLIRQLQDAGYPVGMCVLNAADFDVPQARERISIVGFKGTPQASINLHAMLEPYNKIPEVRTFRNEGTQQGV